MKIFVALLMVAAFAIYSTGCSKTNSNEGNDSAQESTINSENSFSSKDSVSSEDSPKKEESWDGISSDGIDERAFIEDMNFDVLTEVATNFQSLTEEIAKKERADATYVLRGDWAKDVVESEQYKNVINIGNDAMKPLYFIVLKSENQGLYEYICCMALADLYGYENQDDDGTQGWATSKEFIEVITEKIASDKK